MSIVSVTETLESIDLQRIAEYTRKLADIGDGFNKMMSAVYMRDFIVAYDLSSVMLAKAIQAEMQIKNLLDEAEAIAFLDKAPAYFIARNEKPTVESKKAVVCLDPDVKMCKDVYARAAATVSLLRGKVSEFKDAIYAIKSLQNDGYLSAYEGMSR